jgi:hypothetical protein
MLIVDKHVVARELFAAKDNIIIYINNYYRYIEDPVSLNIKSIKKYFLYFIAFLSIIAVEL